MTKVAEHQIKHGYIYLVLEDIYIAQKANKSPSAQGDEVGIRTVIIPRGELLEFRYFTPAHFRDVYNNYFPVDDRQLGKLKAVAKIWEKVNSQNNADLKDILRLSLYDQVEKTNTRVVNIAFMERAKELKRHLDDREVYTNL